MSSSNLLNYIGKLLQDDKALGRFIADPITDAEKTFGLTKAERAVLRRVVSGLSNKSVNGFSMERELDSYRRSLSLLLNVLLNVGSKLCGDVKGADLDPSEAPYLLHVILPSTPGNYSNKTNSDVTPGETKSYLVIMPTDGVTIKQLLDTVSQSYADFSYSSENNGNGEYVSSFVIDGNSYQADLPTSLDTDYVFWFYSVNGTPNKTHPAKTGGDGQSFTTYPIKPNDTTFWQLIAPDSTYGFKSCKPHNLNQYCQNG